MKLRGRMILITGGGSGIGLELATRLAQENDVVIAGRDERKLEQARGRTPELRTLRLDVTSEEDAQRALQWLSHELGGLDLLVNNAGVWGRYTLAAPEAATGSEEELEVNIGGAVRMTRLALPLLEAAPEGGVLFMSSAVALAAVPGHAVYAATKAAVHSFSRSLRAELRPRGTDRAPARGSHRPPRPPTRHNGERHLEGSATHRTSERVELGSH